MLLRAAPFTGCKRNEFDFPIPEARLITPGPGNHWFGYYDKLEFDPENRYALGMQVDFENRPPTASDMIRVGIVDLERGDRWIELGTSFDVTRVLDDGEHRDDVRTLPLPVFCLSPDGAAAYCVDYARIQTFLHCNLTGRKTFFRSIKIDPDGDNPRVLDPATAPPTTAGAIQLIFRRGPGRPENSGSSSSATLHSKSARWAGVSRV